MTRTDRAALYISVVFAVTFAAAIEQHLSTLAESRSEATFIAMGVVE